MQSLKSDRSINAQIDSIHRHESSAAGHAYSMGWRVESSDYSDAAARLFGSFIFEPGPDTCLEPLTYDSENNIGIASTQNTKCLFIFQVGDNAKPVACRGYRKESRVYVYDIKTVADSQGVIRADWGPRTSAFRRPRVVLK